MGDVITLKDILAPSFFRPYNDFLLGRKSTLCLAGGRGSCKSSAISVFILLGMEMDRRKALQLKAKGDIHWRRELTHCLCLRKVANTLADSVYAQFQWAAEKLNLTSKYIFKKTPLMIERVGTGQRIMFRGLDDPQRLKSLRFPMSYGRFLWIEEAAEYDGLEEIQDVQRSVQRGGHDFVTFFSYNPPATSSNWINYKMQELANEDPSFGYYHSDYRSVPRDWLGEKFFHDADILRRINELAYKHQYLGLAVGNGGTVFPNVRLVHLTDEELSRMDRTEIRWGCDFGLRDPTVLAVIYYNKVTHSIVVLDEIYKPDMSLDDMEAEFREMHDKKYGSMEYIVADCAGATLIQTLRQRGLQMIPCKKGADSIMNGIKWLQSLTSIDICDHCKNAYREFINYEYEKNKAGEFTGRLPDHDNHFLDACLAGETKVITENGDIEIKDLVGEKGKVKIFSYDENRKEFTLSKYVSCRKTRESADVYRVVVDGGRYVDGTTDHRILTDKGYVEIGDLDIGDIIVCFGGSKRVTNKFLVNSGVDVYDLEVPDYHNFLVNGGIVVHNCRYACERLASTTSMFG